MDNIHKRPDSINEAIRYLESIWGEDNIHKRPDSINEAIRYLESVWGDYGRHEREVKILVDYIYLLEEELQNKEENIKRYLSIVD